MVPQFWLDHLRHVVVENKYYRRVIFTTPQMQLVAMSITPMDVGIKEETHSGTTQFFCIVEGEGALITNGEHKEMYYAGDAFIVPAGLKHEIVQLGQEPLKLYTIYTPPEHPDGYVLLRNNTMSVEGPLRDVIWKISNPYDVERIFSSLDSLTILRLVEAEESAGMTREVENILNSTVLWPLWRKKIVELSLYESLESVPKEKFFLLWQALARLELIRESENFKKMPRESAEKEMAIAMKSSYLDCIVPLARLLLKEFPKHFAQSLVEEAAAKVATIRTEIQGITFAPFYLSVRQSATVEYDEKTSLFSIDWTDRDLMPDQVNFFNYNPQFVDLNVDYPKEIYERSRKMLLTHPGLDLRYVWLTGQETRLMGNTTDIAVIEAISDQTKIVEDLLYEATR